MLGIKLRTREIYELLFSTLVISFCFTWVQNVFGIEFLMILGIMFIIIGAAFVLHELAHKYVAIRLGLDAEFRAWYLGLFIALILALTVKFFFIAPGAVQIYTIRYITRREEGLISSAGVITNIILSMIFLSLYKIFYIDIFKFGAYINAWLAFINLLPIPPLDGSKIIFWNPVVWFLLIVISIFLRLLI